MELMSSLLFCALVAYLPQAFGESSPSVSEIKFNNSMEIRQMPMPKKVLLNINGPPLVKMVNDLQSVFMDLSCGHCIDCMERAIKAYKTHYHITETILDSDTLHEQVLGYKKFYRNKRGLDSTTTETTTTKTRRTKPKKRASKSITVTKYNVDGNVFALKVKEMTQPSAGQQNDSQVTTCQVFSVKKYFPCDTVEGVSLLTLAKRKVNKKHKRDKDASRASPTQPHFVPLAFRKRQVDNSQISDNFMPSIEDLY